MTYWWDFFAVPVYVAVLLIVALFTAGSTLGLTNAVVAGYLAWVGLEWWIHKVVFHRWRRIDHWAHHRRPRDMGISQLLSAHVTSAAIGAVLILSILALGVHYGSAFAAAALAGYWSYGFCHHAIHNHWVGPFTPLFGAMYRRHDLHHRGVEMNFNVLCPLGDVVMGTYKSVPWSTYDAGKSSN